MLSPEFKIIILFQLSWFTPTKVAQLISPIELDMTIFGYLIKCIVRIISFLPNQTCVIVFSLFILIGSYSETTFDICSI